MDGDQLTVSADEVTVEKRVTTDQFSMPAVILEITSAVDRSVRVTVREPVPESFSMENVGFHPEYGGEHWLVSDHEIVFSRRIDAGGEYTTVYGVRDVGDGAITTFLDAEPSISTGDDIPTGTATTDADAAPISELLTEDDGEVVRNVIAGDDDSLSPAGEDDPEDGSVAETEEAPGEETEDTGDGNTDAEDTDGREAKASEDGGDHDTGADTVGPGKEATAEYRELPGSVAEALAGEIRDGTISEENERVLRETFSEPPETRRNVDRRIKRLQTEVADLAASADEFERILEGGIDGPLESLETDPSNVTERIEELEDSIDVLNRQMAEIEAGLDAVRDDLDAIEDGTEDTHVPDRPENVEMEVEDVRYLEEMVMELEDEIDVVRQLEEAAETLETEMGEMKAFRDRLSSAFGSGTGYLGERGE